MKVTLTRIFRGEKETKYGVRNSVGIKTVEHGDKWVSALFDPKKGANGTESWKEGDQVEIFVTEKEGYINFTLKPTEASAIAGLEARVKVLEDKVLGTSTESVDPDGF